MKIKYLAGLAVKYAGLLFILSVLPTCDDSGSSPSFVKVFKYDGSVQCETSGIGLEEMAAELIDAGIDVICSQKGHDGYGRAAVCGGETGDINIYTIYKVNLSDAQSLGFESVNNLEEYRDQACEE